MPIKVLIVDDEPDLELLVRQKFRRQIRDGEFECVFARDGAQALERLLADPDVDVVLTDLNMPVMDGLTLLSRIEAVNEMVRTVVVSAYGDLGNIRTAMNRGAFDFVTKPIDFEDLLVTVRKTARQVEALRQARQQRAQLSAIQHELDVATRIQRAILPRDFPVFPAIEEFDLFAEMVPAREVGGDLYDFFLIDGDHLGIAIGDVADKGVPAAIYMAVTRTILRSVAMAGLPAGDCLREVNRLLTRENASCMFVTLFYGVLDLRSGELGFCNAGHNPIWWLARGGALEPLTTRPTLALGISEDFPYRTDAVTLAAGDSLFLYTDGIPEAWSATGEMFSDDRLQRLLRRHAHDTPRALVEGVVAEVLAFAGGAPQADDLTLLAVRYRPGSLEASDGGEVLSLQLKNDITELAGVPDAVDGFIAAQGLPSKLASEVNLALEEALTNIITHGYDDGESHAIDVRLSSDPEWITLTIEDDARSFDPLGAQHVEPDVGASVEDRPIGGLGIFLLKKVMDHVEYRRHDGRNRLVLKKRLPGSRGGPWPADRSGGGSSADATAGDAH